MVRLVANVDHIRTVVRQFDISATVGHVICVGRRDSSRHEEGDPMSKRRGIVSRLFEGLGRVTWGVIRHEIDERRSSKSRKR